MKRILSAVAGVIAMVGVSTTALADQRSDLTEVEVSLWEIVGAIMYYALDHGDVALAEYNTQQDDVAEFWNAFKAGASAEMAAGIEEFEGAYADVLEHANQVVNAATVEDAITAANSMWRAAHLADDILDFQLKAVLTE